MYTSPFLDKDELKWLYGRHDISCLLAIQSLTQTLHFIFLPLLPPYSVQATGATLVTHFGHVLAEIRTSLPR